MADKNNEPQSYGSQGDWVRGDVAEEVNRLKGNPNSQHSDFYESRRESETNAPEQGGFVSPEQLAENVEPVSGGAYDAEGPVQKVTDEPSGAKRDSYFKRRDYE